MLKTKLIMTTNDKLANAVQVKKRKIRQFKLPK